MKVVTLMLVLMVSAVVAQRKPFADAELITANQLRAYLEFMASDELQGRDTPSLGLDIAAKFIASHLARWGVEPGGEEGTYFQKIEVTQTTVDPASKLTLKGKDYFYGKDFLLTAKRDLSVDAEVCFAGHGWYVPSRNINPYEGLNIRNKVVVVTDLVPTGLDFKEIGRFGVDYMTPATYATKHGAVAVVYVPNYRSLVSWDKAAEFAVERGTMTIGSENSTLVPQITLSLRLLTALFEDEVVSAGFLFSSEGNSKSGIKPFYLSSDKVLRLNIITRMKKLSTSNVIGIVRGSDPKLKNEYVALGAHYDHVGVASWQEGDNIYNGADDNASGTVALMAIAEAFARGYRPRRSLLFVWHTAEEKGLLGSAYFVQHPTVPLDSIIAQLNIDMIGRSRQNGDTTNLELSGPDEVYVIGARMLSSELGELSEQVNNTFLRLKFNYKYDDPDDPNRFFYRSDHYNYAKQGIPTIFYFTGVHEDYHRPTDHASKIDFEKMTKITKTIYATALELAMRPKRPAVDRDSSNLAFP
ncbi:MAG: M20/M25/M40 family metallo-hydrolase [Acidobacteriota bacterium]|nr:M20/M25/M40 family metallo-hydrolase [Blastocatellia bacterium]MDW8413802.1 M20/M25/M40 family metallo-hydrolase [Acidobacteriota bacterium]